MTPHTDRNRIVDMDGQWSALLGLERRRVHRDTVTANGTAD